MANESYTSSGALRVSVFSGSIGRPEAGALVTVRTTDGTIINEQRTDQSGRLPELRLPAPARGLSTTPQDEETPFAEYNITVRSTEGSISSVENAQVYAGETSLQSVTFLSQNTEVEVENPAIMGGQPEKIPENEVKPLPDDGGTVVLPEPVVPEFIIVHDGAPNDSTAKNYTLRYTEYIKNVASSEIFSTWNREAIKANLLAISSFTINRIYTEWYRARGYDFNITSSTAYDQAFSYGRTIFSSISEVADEIFGTFIVRRGVNQPLFSQYCDGRRVQRAGWLSQWGSQELASQGLSALQILRYYYGRDIYLSTAPKVEGIPLSFKGVLRIGSRGEAVRTIQRQLSRISKNFPLIPAVADDGIFGPKTANSVRVFEQVFNMPVTGVVNYPVWYRISDIYTAVTGLSENR